MGSVLFMDLLIFLLMIEAIIVLMVLDLLNPTIEVVPWVLSLLNGLIEVY